MSVWKLISTDDSVNDTFENLNLINGVRNRQSAAVDTMSITHQPDDGILESPLLSYNSVVRITKDDAPWFAGYCRDINNEASNPDESISYQIVGPWLDLERITYEQEWLVWSIASEASVHMRKDRLILCQDVDGNRISIGQQIKEVIEWAIEQGALIALPDGTFSSWGWPSMMIPWEEIKSLSCSEVIIRLLAFIPDYKVWIDYSQETPVFNLSSRGAATARSYALGTADITTKAITPRHDLQAQGVTVKFERTHTVDGATWETISEQTAGNTAHPDAITMTLQLAGANLSSQSAYIQTEDPPDDGGDPPVVDWLDKTWWKKKVPTLAAIADADLFLTAATQIVEPHEEGEPAYDITEIPHILISGMVPSWIEGAKIARVAIKLTYSSVARDLANNIIEVRKDQQVALQLTMCNISTGAYTRQEGDHAEPEPTGFATALYNAWNQLQYDGRLIIEEEEPSRPDRPGDVLNITSARGEWATMNAQIQQIQEDIAIGRTTIIFGPASRIDPATLLSLMRRIRARVIPFNHLVRTTGKAADRANGVQIGGKVPDAQADPYTGEPLRVRIVAGNPDPEGADPDFAAEIDLNPAAIDRETGDPSSVEITPRRMVLLERSEGGDIMRVTRHILASDSVGTPVVEDVGGLPDGTSTGQILYWSGSAWVRLNVGTEGYILRAGSSIPEWSPETSPWPTTTMSDPTHVLGRKGTVGNYTYGWVEVDTFSCP
jgi:hypothetical protein